MIPLARTWKLGDLVALHGGEIDLDPSVSIATVGPSDREGDWDLSPVLHERGAAQLASRAKVLLVAEKIAARIAPGRRWIHPQADRVLAELLEAEESREVPEFPADSLIEPGAIVFPGVRIGRGVVIGAGSIIGRRGFGYVGNLRIPHRAGVVLEDGVEIGALCTVDAGILSPTTIGRDTKIDSHVHVGHGVRIGARCRIAAQVGFAGSVVVEDDVWIGGQAGIADHCRIGRGARIAAKAGVIGDIAAGEVVAGYPAVARSRWLRGHARLYRR
ncbi:MAG: DapH/DapD/GlmU-related protein [Polyangiales bacterium]